MHHIAGPSGNDEFGERVTAKERVTRRLIANREGKTAHQQKMKNRPAYEKMPLTQLPKMYSGGDRQCRRLLIG